MTRVEFGCPNLKGVRYMEFDDTDRIKDNLGASPWPMPPRFGASSRRCNNRGPTLYRTLCWVGVHRGWYLKRQYMEDAAVLSRRPVPSFHRTHEEGPVMPSIGVGTFVVTFENGVLKFLLGLRSKVNKRGPGVWALPSGMLDPSETLAQCTKREVMEETGLEVEVDEIDEFVDCAVGVSHHYPREDHLTVWTVATYAGTDKPKVMEPNKCEEWRWVTIPEFVALTPQEGEQVHWAPHRVMQILLPRMGFPPF